MLTLISLSFGSVIISARRSSMINKTLMDLKIRLSDVCCLLFNAEHGKSTAKEEGEGARCSTQGGYPAGISRRPFNSNCLVQQRHETNACALPYPGQLSSPLCNLFNFKCDYSTCRV